MNKELEENVEKVLHPLAKKIGSKVWKLMQESIDKKWAPADKTYVIIGSCVGVMAFTYSILVKEGVITKDHVVGDAADNIREWFVGAFNQQFKEKTDEQNPVS